MTVSYEGRHWGCGHDRNDCSGNCQENGGYKVSAAHTENEKTHTPGPWKVEYQVGNYYYILPTDCRLPGMPNNPQHIGTVSGWDKRVDANARLIAAAPELADTLSLLIRTVDDTVRHGFTNGQLEALALVHGQARAVLNKATIGA
jgi:hypothetical protein